MNDQNLRKNLVELLQGGSAHIQFSEAIANVNPELRNFRPEPRMKSIFEHLEHMRIAQEDIIRYTIEEGWESPAFPDGYWPDVEGQEINDATWDSTIHRFKNDLVRAIDLTNDQTIDLTEEIPHGGGRTYLREILLIADHNSYHIGKIVDIRKSLGDW